MEMTLKILLLLVEQYDDPRDAYNPICVILRSLSLAELRNIFNTIGDEVERLTLTNKPISRYLVVLSEYVGYEISRQS